MKKIRKSWYTISSLFTVLLILGCGRSDWKSLGGYQPTGCAIFYYDSEIEQWLNYRALNVIKDAAGEWNWVGSYFRFYNHPERGELAPMLKLTGECFDIMLGELLPQPGSPYDTPAARTFLYVIDSTLYISHVIFNTLFMWSTDGTPASWEFDLKTVAMHEFGHCLGLDDVDDENQIMYRKISRGEVRSLGPGDREGIETIYGIGTPLEAPSNVTLELDRENDKLHISWDPVEGADGYIIYLYSTDNNGFTRWQWWGSETNSYTYENISADVNTIEPIVVMVRAYHNVVINIEGEEVTRTYYSDFSPQQGLFKLTARGISESEILDKWRYYNRGFSGYFVIERSMNGTDFDAIGTVEADTIYIDDGVEFGTTYWYRIKAYTGEGLYLGYSNVDSALPALNVPSNFTATSNEYLNRITLTWQDNSNYEDGYIIEEQHIGSDWQVLDTLEANTESYTHYVSRYTDHWYRLYGYSSTYDVYSDTVYTWATTSPILSDEGSLNNVAHKNLLRKNDTLWAVYDYGLFYSADNGMTWWQCLDYSFSEESAIWGNSDNIFIAYL